VLGWIEKVRDQKTIQFIIIKDRHAKLQITVEKEKLPQIAEIFSTISTDSVIEVTGEIVKNEHVKLGGIEMIPSAVVVHSHAEVAPIDHESSLDQRLDYRWIDLRDPKKRLIFEAQTVLVQGMRDYCLKNGYTEVHNPTIMSNASEGGSGVFEIKYFDKKAYLIQSPQFYKQMAIAAGFEKVFMTTPVYRAEKSFTKQHATEFTGFDIEISNVNDVEDVMKEEEGILHSGLKLVHEKLGKRIKEEMGVDIVVPTLPFPRITMMEAYKILDEECDYTIYEGSDFDREAETLLCKYMMKKTGHQFFFVKEYPASVRAFYSMAKDDGSGYSKTFDLYYKDIEITSGAQREHRPKQLTENIKAKGIDPATLQSTYIDFFRYGCPPHGGFGLGLDRLTMLMLDVPTVKEAMYLFRGPDRITP
jgi:aspartyl-tRNA synthetase